MPEPRKAELLRGLAWNIPAAVGGPVDLIEQVINLGMAAGATAGHKLGLLRADQLPKPLEGSVGTTKWWAKGTPMEESSDPNFVKGQIAGALATALYPSVSGKVSPGTLRSILIDPDWLKKYNIPDAGPDGRPLGRLRSAEGAESVALPRQRTPQDTFPKPAMEGAFKLGDLSPEVKGTPLEGVEVYMGPDPKVLGGPQVMGHADFADNSVVMRTVNPDTGQPYSPLELMGLLHHEATHFADAKRGALSSGSWVDRVPDRGTNLDLVRETAKFNPEVAKAANRQWARSPYQRYQDDLGEIKARTAQTTASMIAPSSGTLDVMYKAQAAGREPTVPVVGPNAVGTMLLPADLFRKGGPLQTRPITAYTQEVFDQSGRTIGLIDNTHAVRSEHPLQKGLAGRFDPQGIGGTPYNTDVDYFGFTRNMPAREFLQLATKTELDPARIKWLMEQQQAGKAFGNPFFKVEADKAGKAYQITDHEGRHRAQALINLFGPDAQVPVDIFPMGLRRHNLDEQMMSWPLRFQKD